MSYLQCSRRSSLSAQKRPGLGANVPEVDGDAPALGVSVLLDMVEPEGGQVKSLAGTAKRSQQ
jgi:hypothetical protein